MPQMKSTGFHQVHYKSTHISVPYIKVRGMSVFFSSSSIHERCNMGHSLFSPVAGLSIDSDFKEYISAIRVN